MRIGWFLLRCTPSSFVQERDEESKLESAQIAGLDPNTLVDHVPVDIPDVMQNFSGSLSMNVELTASLEGDGSSIRVENVRGNGDFGPVMSCIPSNDHLAHSAQSESMVVSSSICQHLNETTSIQFAGSDPNAIVDHVPVDIADVIQNNTLSSNTKSTVSVVSVKVFPSNLDVFRLIRCVLI